MRNPLLLANVTIAAMLPTFVLFLFFKRRGPFYRIYKEALHLEDNNAYPEAIELYELILEQSSWFTIKDHSFIAAVTQRIKTLQANISC